MEYTHLSPPAELGLNGGAPGTAAVMGTASATGGQAKDDAAQLPFMPAFGLVPSALALASPASGSGSGSTSPAPLAPPPSGDQHAPGSSTSVASASTSALIQGSESWSRHLGPGKACARCRLRKLRCSGTRPVCTSCQRVQTKAERQARKAGLPPPDPAEFACLCVYDAEPSRRQRRSARTPTPGPGPAGPGGLGSGTNGPSIASFSPVFSPVSAVDSYVPHGSASPPSKRARTSTAGSSSRRYDNPLESLAAAAAATLPERFDRSAHSPSSTCTGGGTGTGAGPGAGAPATTEPSLEARLHACVPPTPLLAQRLHTFTRECPWLCPWDTDALEQRIWGSAAVTGEHEQQDGDQEKDQSHGRTLQRNSQCVRPHSSLLLAILAWVHTLYPDLPFELPAEGAALLTAQSTLSVRLLPDSSPGAQYASLARAGLCADTVCARSRGEAAGGSVAEERAWPCADERRSLRWDLDVLQARVVLDHFTFAQALLSHTSIEAGATDRLATRLARIPSLSAPAVENDPQATPRPNPEPDALDRNDLSLLLAGWVDAPAAGSGHGSAAGSAENSGELSRDMTRTHRLAHAFHASLDSSQRLCDVSILATSGKPTATHLLDMYFASMEILGQVALPLDADVPPGLLVEFEKLDEALVPHAEENPADPLARSALLALLAGDMLLHTPLGAPAGEARGGRVGLVRAIHAIDRAMPLIQAGAGNAAAHPPMAAWCVTQLAAGLIRLAAGGAVKARSVADGPYAAERPETEKGGPILRALLAPEHDGGEEARQRLLQDAFQLCWLFLDQYGTRFPLGHATKQALHHVLEQLR